MPGPRTDKVGVGGSKETRTGGSIREGSWGRAARRACEGHASRVADDAGYALINTRIREVRSGSPGCTQGPEVTLMPI